MSKQVLNEQTYSAAHTQELTGGRTVTKSMTYGGTIIRSLFLIIITLGFAAVGWQWAARVATTSGLWFFLGYILLIALTFAAVNNPRIAAVAGIVYAALMGTWMGSISRIYETYYEGIVGQALLTTVCVFIACLLLYSLRVVRVTGKFIRVLIISIFGITLLYLFGWFVSIFGVRLNFLYNGSTDRHRDQRGHLHRGRNEPDRRLRGGRNGREGRRAGRVRVVRGVRIADHAGLALPGDPVPAGAPPRQRLIRTDPSG